MHCGGIRHSNFTGKEIKKVAVLGGAGSFAIKMRFKLELMLI
jgi:putative NIF3 family GTP cyclohydrolase 1 type 2